MQPDKKEIPTGRIMISHQDLFRLSNIVMLMKRNRPLIKHHLFNYAITIKMLQY